MGSWTSYCIPFENIVFIDRLGNKSTFISLCIGVVCPCEVTSSKTFIYLQCFT